MIKKYNILVKSNLFGFDSNIYLPKYLFNKCHKSSIKVKYGSAYTYANIKLSHDDNIYISSSIRNILYIILGTKYQIKIKKNELSIGPVIGIFVTNRERLPMSKSRMYKRYLPLINKTGGVLVFLKSNTISYKDNTINGFVYIRDKGKFEEVKIHTPKYIYRRTNISHNTMEQLVKRKIHVYNKLFMNKHRFYTLVKDSPELSKYLPVTTRYSKNELDSYLDNNNNVILKPVYGSKGYGIYVIKKKGNIYTIRENEFIKILEFNAKEKLLNHVESEIGTNRYIIQEYINTPKYKDRYFTIRVVTQLEPNKKYNVTSINAYTGETNSDIGNNNYGKTLYLRLSIICSELKIDFKELYCRLKTISIELANYLKEHNHKLIDMGIDYIVDSNLNIYLLEVNKNHTHEVSLKAGDTKGYIKTKYTPIRYLISKSGFKLEGE